MSPCPPKLQPKVQLLQVRPCPTGGEVELELGGRRVGVMVVGEDPLRLRLALELGEEVVDIGEAVLNLCLPIEDEGADQGRTLVGGTEIERGIGIEMRIEWTGVSHPLGVTRHLGGAGEDGATGVVGGLGVPSQGRVLAPEPRHQGGDDMTKRCEPVFSPHTYLIC
jgi:hypothetical protein